MRVCIQTCTQQSSNYASYPCLRIAAAKHELAKVCKGKRLATFREHLVRLLHHQSGEWVGPEGAWGSLRGGLWREDKRMTECMGRSTK